MTCTSPFLLKHEGNIIELPCGHCVACRIARSREWASRIIHEMEYYPGDCSFVTLTYNNDFLPSDFGLHLDTFQKFLKRLRRDLGKKKIRYYGCGEYGDLFGRPHYHVIFFGISCSESDQELVKQNWPFGNVYFGSVTFNSARYVAAYVQKKYSGNKAKEVYGDRQAPFQVCSKGIGKRFVIDNSKQLSENQGFTINGAHVGLPRYYRDKIDLDTTAIKQRAIAKAKDAIERFREKGMIPNDSLSGLSQAKQEIRDQAALNLDAKIAIHERKYN